MGVLWAQCRLMLPAWYGFGSAVNKWIAAHPEQGLPFLQAMAREWPFFQTLLANMDMVLVKSDIGIASRYMQLVEDVTLRETIFARLRGEWQASIAALLAILGPDRAARTRSAACPHHPRPLPLYRSAQPRSARAAEALPRRRHG